MAIENDHPHRNVCRGLIAGAVGGFAASYVMSRFHALLHKPESSAQESKEDSTVKAASRISETIFHHTLTVQEKEIAGLAVHYGFGTGMGAIYGTAVEIAPSVRNGWGTPFGVAVWLGAHVITVPALGLSEPVTASSPWQEAAEFAAHLLYGAVVETVRKLIADFGR